MKALNNRLLRHAAFWLAYWLVMGFIGGRYDLRFERAYLHEAMELPVRMLLVYAALYRAPLLERGRWTRWLAEVFLFTLIALILRRMLMFWVIYPMFYAIDYSMAFWDLNRLIYSWIDHALVLFAVLFVRFARQTRVLAVREQALQLEKATAELHALRSQTNPHFLFNTLTSIYALARKNDPRTPEIVMKLAGLLRFILYECEADAIPLSRELQIIGEYVELEKLRFSNRVLVEADVEMWDPRQRIPPLLLLPLVENAFKHGVGESRGVSKIRYTLRQPPGSLKFRIENSRETGSIIPETPGIGLRNLRRQLELLYPGHYLLTIEEKPHIFAVDLDIQLPDRWPDQEMAMPNTEH